MSFWVEFGILLELQNQSTLSQGSVDWFYKLSIVFDPEGVTGL